MSAYYNEFDPYPAQWLRNLIAAGHLPAGEVDERSIVDVAPEDLRGFTACHFFAGIGGWAYAGRLAGWPDDRPWWTGSCPCQPFSVAGKQAGFDDERHLWPVWQRLIAKRKPTVIFGEQVAGAADWLRLVRSDLEALGYAVGAAPVEAASAGADHKRDRFWFVADSYGNGRPASSASGLHNQEYNAEPRSSLVNAAQFGCGEGQPQPELRRGRSAASGTGLSSCDVADSHTQGSQIGPRQSGYAREECSPTVGDSGPGSWLPGQWLMCADGKARRVEPTVCLLAHGVPARVGKLRAYGNAIDPRAAKEIIGAYLDCAP